MRKPLPQVPTRLSGDKETQKKPDLTGCYTGLNAILSEIRSYVDAIIEMTEISGSKIDEIKFYLGVLGSARDLDLDAAWIYEALNTIHELLSNGEVQKMLAKIPMESLLGAIKRARGIFYPYVPEASELTYVKPARLEENRAFGQGGNEEFYQRLNELLQKDKDRKNDYKGKATKNPRKRDAFRLFSKVVMFHLPEGVVWVALQFLHAVSEVDSKARNLFLDFYNTEFPEYVKRLPNQALLKDMPMKLSLDDPQLKLNSRDPKKKAAEDKIVDEILCRVVDLALPGEDPDLLRYRLRTLLKIVEYDETLNLKGSSLCHYSEMGEEIGRTTNRRKGEEARKQFYNVVLGGRSAEQIFKATSGFVLHSKPGSNGEKIFRSFYIETCQAYFPDVFQIIKDEDNTTYLGLYSPVNIQDDKRASWVLYTALHSIVLSFRDIFKEDMVRGKWETLSDLAAGRGSGKAIKIALLKLKLSIEFGADLSQLVEAANQVKFALDDPESGYIYSKAANRVAKVLDSFVNSRGVEKEDVRTHSHLDEFKEIYSYDISGKIDFSNEIKNIAVNSKKLALRLANLRVRIEFGRREDIYSTLTQLLTEFGSEIRKSSSALYDKLFEVFVRLSQDYRIHPIGNEMKMVHVPLSWARQKEGHYTLNAITLDLASFEALGPTLRGHLSNILNTKMDTQSLGIDMISLNAGHCITVFSNEDLRDPLLQIKIENMEGKTRVSLKTFASSSDAISSFDKLPPHLQCRILTRVAEALTLGIIKTPRRTQAGEKEIQRIHEAAYFPNLISSEPEKEVQASRLSRTSVSGAVDEVRKRAASLFRGSRTSGSKREPVISDPVGASPTPMRNVVPLASLQAGVAGLPRTSAVQPGLFSTAPHPSPAQSPPPAENDSSDNLTELLLDVGNVDLSVLEESTEGLPDNLPPPPRPAQKVTATVFTPAAGSSARPLPPLPSRVAVVAQADSDDEEEESTESEETTPRSGR